MPPKAPPPFEPKSGHGTFWYSDHCRYEGEWTEIKTATEEIIKVKHGKGKYIDTDDNNYYEGNFENDMFHGKGLMKFKNGTTYEGDFNQNKMEGFGKYTFVDGSVYEGEFKDNKIHGNGVFHSKDGKQWKGTFYNNFGDGIETMLP